MTKITVIFQFLFLSILFCDACKKKAAGSVKEEQQIEPKPGFIYRDQTLLMLDGKPYKCVSFNSFQLSGCGFDYELYSNQQVEELFASLPDNIMIRTWAFPGSEYDAKVDLLIKAAEKHQVKLLLTFGDGRSYCGHSDGAIAGDGSGKKQEWYTGGFRKTYLPHLAEMANKYKNSPAVGVWEILNEPGDTDWKTIKVFLDEVAAVIKKYDPNHLVSSGTLAPWTYDGEDNFKKMHDSPNIDIGTLHEYDYDYLDSKTIESPHFADAQRAMSSLKKVLIVEETGINSGESCATDQQTRAQAMKAKCDLYLAKGAAAVLVWNFAQSTKGCNFTFSASDPLFEMIKSYPVNLGR